MQESHSVPYRYTGGQQTKRPYESVFSCFSDTQLTECQCEILKFPSVEQIGLQIITYLLHLICKLWPSVRVYDIYSSPELHSFLFLYFLRPLSFLRSSQETTIQMRKLSPFLIHLCSAATSVSTRGVGSTTLPCVWRSWAATRSRGSDTAG